MDAGELRALRMAKRSRTLDKGRANPSRHSPATPPIGSFDLVLRIINGEFDGPELVAIYQAAYLRLLEVSPGTSPRRATSPAWRPGRDQAAHST